MKIIKALIWLLLTSLCSQNVLAAQQRKSTSKLHVSKKKTGRKKRSSKAAGRTQKSALKYLPKIRKYVKPVSALHKKAIRKNQSKKTVRQSSLREKSYTVISQQQEPEKIFSWPVDPKNFWISSPFGSRTIRGKEGFHGGIDLAAPTGTDVYAASAGTVVESRYSPGYGNYIMIAHENGYKTRYAHLNRSLVRSGQQVEEGGLIGKVGATGRIVKRRSSSSGAHLHFEIYRQGTRVDPMGYIR